MKANVYKVEMLVIDHERMSEDAVRFLLQDQEWVSRVMKLEVKEVEWDDSHPLNHRDKQEMEFQHLFGDQK